MHGKIQGIKIQGIKILFLGDIVGDPGRAIFKKHARALRQEHGIDLLIVNGENAASDGRGITPTICHFFKEHGADVITTGNHIWAKKEIIPFIDTEKELLLRPLNFPSGCPGSGVTLVKTASGIPIGVINVQGRTFMKEQLSCPLRAVDSALTFLQSRTPIIFVDMHAEATSEKMGMGYYLDGRVSAVVGTHTHVPTADERILPQGTAYITDVGMAGALNSMIGMKKEIIIRQMLTQMPAKYMVETELPYQMCGVVVTIEPSTGRALAIERIKVVDDQVPPL